MLGFSKKAVLAAALIAFGLVAGENLITGTAGSAPFSAEAAVSDAPVIQDAALGDRAARTLQMLLEGPAAGASMAPATRPYCRDQAWPYYRNECLVGRDGKPVSGTVRIVRAERPAGS
jgi:hypothetical protein